MAIFRQYIAPLLVVLIFFAALVAVSARIFLPSDMAAPAPVEDTEISMMMRDLSKTTQNTTTATALTDTALTYMGMTYTTTTSPPIG